ncbi:LacI family DNA-binding transcriptional regulator [Ruminococcaceae bacterium OttesenSCG-928-L11]|nr:LacI family DNA-binding transcriptional regulator [Ruminococcaceae bacterium OttesenSCG-928-L11]
MITLKELARRAGVSVSTVSRVVNGNDEKAAGRETRERIWQIVRESGYVPDEAAQGLKRREDPRESTGRIACVFARAPHSPTDPFFSQIARSIEHSCLTAGYGTMGTFTADAFLEGGHPPPDGVVVLGRYSRSFLAKLRQVCQHIVYAGLNSVRDPVDQVVCDGYGAAREAVRYLYALGHRRICYVGELDNEARFRGFYDENTQMGCKPGAGLIAETLQSREGGYTAARRLLQGGDLPDALFCANDLTALGVLDYAAEAAVPIPQALSVISIDNIEACQRSSPMLTSIDIPKEEIGRVTARVLIDRMEGGHSLPLHVQIPFTLCKRGSCQPK